MGLSPRVRGKQHHRRIHPGGGGSIPACAGETQCIPDSGIYPEVYPRVCGGNSQRRRRNINPQGLSPRVRGETSNISCWPCDSRVYPRVCGGNWNPLTVISRVKGLSPRVRGKHRHRTLPYSLLRSIPACAGETRPAPKYLATSEVYPRVCGGNHPRLPRGLCGGGLSPRVRGKRGRVDEGTKRRRSIPACAGETPAASIFASRLTVYPRVCGGNMRRGNALPAARGLSPRVRGKLPTSSVIVILPGSIPACAGETW